MRFSTSVRAVLREAEGFVILSAGGVCGILLMYVVAAVPANWLIFRALGRPEWAWIALPMLSVGFAAASVRLAGLDLGFVRSSVEVVVAELQPDYERAHLTRHVAIYNSLGTAYDFTGGDPALVVLPQAPTLDRRPTSRPTMLLGRTFIAGRPGDDASGRAAALAGFVVDSNSIGLVRSEQTASLGGGITAVRVEGNRYRVVNGTRLELRDVRIVGNGRGFVSVLRPGATADLTLADVDPRAGNEAARRADVDVDSLWQACQTLPPDESLRLVAWSPDRSGRTPHRARAVAASPQNAGRGPPALRRTAAPRERRQHAAFRSSARCNRSRDTEPQTCRSPPPHD